MNTQVRASDPIKCCALPLCNLVENLRVCSRCKIAYYCGKDHQRRDWRSHKKTCYIAEHTSPTTVSDPSVKSQNGDVLAMANQDPSQAPTNPFSVARSHAEEGDTSYVDLQNLHLTQNPSAAAAGSVEQETTKFSDHIIHSNSYPLTPLTDEEEEHDEDRAKSDAPLGGWQVGATEQMIPSGPSRYPPGRVGLRRQPKEWLEKLNSYLVDCLHRFGICVIDRVLGTERGEAILKEVLNLHHHGDRFSDGQLVKDSRTAKKGEIRGDKIMWTDGLDPNCKNIQWLISQMDTIIHMTNGHFENINISTRTKAMVACYPGGGTHYVKHVDNPNRDGRCITCIYYLNKGWDSRKDGGLLRMYPEGHDNMACVEPVFDRMLFFWSDRRNPHEVLPAYRTRYAITVWYFNPAERAKAKSDIASKQLTS